ncbi:MAG: PaaI family thioesterase [Armatimonadetes bacterium]|nr:PaaI family thioesterase [Armatimonadota bacterium]
MSQRAAHRCFVCGPANPLGLRLHFTLAGDEAHTDFVPGPHHVGYEGAVHGGILTAVLDDAMANLFALRGEEAVTMRMEVRFRRPVAPGVPLRVTGRVVRVKSRVVTAEARAVTHDGTVVAEAEGTFMRRPLEPSRAGV